MRLDYSQCRLAGNCIVRILAVFLSDNLVLILIFTCQHLGIQPARLQYRISIQRWMKVRVLPLLRTDDIERKSTGHTTRYTVLHLAAGIIRICICYSSQFLQLVTLRRCHLCRTPILTLLLPLIDYIVQSDKVIVTR